MPVYPIPRPLSEVSDSGSSEKKFSDCLKVISSDPTEVTDLVFVNLRRYFEALIESTNERVKRLDKYLEPPELVLFCHYVCPIDLNYVELYETLCRRHSVLPQREALLLFGIAYDNAYNRIEPLRDATVRILVAYHLGHSQAAAASSHH